MKISGKISFFINVDQVGQRLDRVMSALSEISSRAFAQSLIEKQLVFVDHKLAKPSLVLKLGQLVECEIPAVAQTELQPLNLKLDIIFEDQFLIVVNKPAHLVVHPAVGHQQDTLVNALLAHTQDLSMKNEMRPGIVHRIDKETSGLLVIAKNDFVHEHLSVQFKNKTTHRVYYALVEGVVAMKTGTICSYLARHPSHRQKYASLKFNNKIQRMKLDEEVAGKWAVTHYENLESKSGMTLMKINLETGRTHQIRVHMCEMGHPLVGDLSYGFSQMKYKKLGINRFFLHAAELGFIHPQTQEFMKFNVDWPIEDREYIKNLGFNFFK